MVGLLGAGAAPPESTFLSSSAAAGSPGVRGCVLLLDSWSLEYSVDVTHLQMLWSPWRFIPKFPTFRRGREDMEGHSLVKVLVAPTFPRPSTEKVRVFQVNQPLRCFVSVFRPLPRCSSVSLPRSTDRLIGLSLGNGGKVVEAFRRLPRIPRPVSHASFTSQTRAILSNPQKELHLNRRLIRCNLQPRFLAHEERYREGLELV